MDSELLRRHVAAHEAGHGVIARVLNIVCGDCLIGEETWPDGHVSHGNANFVPLEIIRMDRHYQGLQPSYRALLFDFCRATMAGREAEVLLLGEQAEDSDGGDREFIDWFLTNPAAIAMGADNMDQQLRQETQALCVEHAGRIHAVANVLSDKRRLSDAEIRAVADIPRPAYDGRLIPVGGWRPCEGVWVGRYCSRALPAAAPFQGVLRHQC
jgi:hypothetical protein